MPKTLRRQNDHINLMISSDEKMRIKAFSHVWGNDNGRISHTTRRMLKIFIDQYLKTWGESEQEKLDEFNAVLENLYKQEELEALAIAEKLETKELAE